MKPALAELLHNPLLWRGDRLARTEDAVSSGFASLDRELPGGGWPKAVLTELCADAEGIGELSLLLPAIRRLTQAGEWIALLAPPHIPYAPALAGRGIDPARMIVIETEEDKDRWWAAEQVLRANSAGALLFWPKTSTDQRTRRLQLAAQEGKALAFLFTSTLRAAQSSPSPLRIRLSSSGSALSIDIFKRRGGVLSRPLLLDVKTGTDHDYSPPKRLTDHRSPSPIRPIRPVRSSHARIWNRALARADELRRMPGPDPRERATRNEAKSKPGERFAQLPSESSPCELNPSRE
jgi:cell division inhibitor SulA